MSASFLYVILCFTAFALNGTSGESGHKKCRVMGLGCRSRPPALREPSAKRRRSSSPCSPSNPRPRRRRRHRSPSRQAPPQVETSEPKRTSRKIFKRYEELFGCETPPPCDEPEPPREQPERTHDRPIPRREEQTSPQERTETPSEEPEAPHERPEPTRGPLEPPHEELRPPHERPEPPGELPEPPCMKPDEGLPIPVKMEHYIPLRNRIKFEDTSSDDDDDIVFVGIETAPVQLTVKDTSNIATHKLSVNKDNDLKQCNNYVKPCPKSRKPGANNNVIIVGTKRRETLENSVVPKLPKQYSCDGTPDKEISKLNRSSDNLTSASCFNKRPNISNEKRKIPNSQNHSIHAAIALGTRENNISKKKKTQKRHFKGPNVSYLKKDLIQRKRHEKKCFKSSRPDAKKWKVKSKGQTKLSFVCKENDKNNLHPGKQSETSENLNDSHNKLHFMKHNQVNDLNELNDPQSDIAFKMVAETELIAPAAGEYNETIDQTSLKEASELETSIEFSTAAIKNNAKKLEEIQINQHDKNYSQQNTGSKVEFNRGDITMAVSLNSVIQRLKPLVSLTNNAEIIPNTEIEIKMEFAIDDKAGDKKNKLEDENTFTVSKVNKELVENCNSLKIKVEVPTLENTTSEKFAFIDAEQSANMVKEYPNILIKPIESLLTPFTSALDESKNVRIDEASNESLRNKNNNLQGNLKYTLEIPYVIDQPVDSSSVMGQYGLDPTLRNYAAKPSEGKVSTDIKELAQNVVLFLQEIDAYKKKIVEAEKFLNQTDILKSTAKKQLQEYTTIFVQASNNFFLKSPVNWFKDHSLFDKLLNAAKAFAEEYKLLETIDLELFTRIIMDMFARNQNNVGNNNTHINTSCSQAMQLNLQNNAKPNFNIDGCNYRNGENGREFVASEPLPQPRIQKNLNYSANRINIPGTQNSEDASLFASACPINSLQNPFLPQGVIERTGYGVAKVIQNKENLTRLPQKLQQSDHIIDSNFLLNKSTGYPPKFLPSYDTHTHTHNIKVSGNTNEHERPNASLQRPNDHQNINGHRPQYPQMPGAYSDTQNPYLTMTTPNKFSSPNVGLNQTQFRQTLPNSSRSSTLQYSAPPPYHIATNHQYSTNQPYMQKSNLNLQYGANQEMMKINARLNAFPPYSVNQPYVGANNPNQQRRPNEQLRYNQQPYMYANNPNQQRGPHEDQIRNNQQSDEGTNNPNQQRRHIEEQLRDNQQPYVGTHNPNQQHRPTEEQLINNQQPYVGINRPNQQHRPTEEHLRNIQSSYFAPQWNQLNEINQRPYYYNTANGACQAAATNTVPAPQCSGDSAAAYSSALTATQHDQLRSLSRDSGIMSPTIPATKLPFEPVISSVTSLNPTSAQNYDKHAKGPCKVCKAQTVLKCTNCYTSYYCSYRCQKIDWDRDHQYVCTLGA